MLPLLLAVMAAFLGTSSAYQCYICSWSPRDSNRGDNCTDENFDSRFVPSDFCELGCEIFVQWDPNGALDQWRRNCVQRDTDITRDCKAETTVAWRRKRCTCSSDFCNPAMSLHRTIWPLTLVACLAIVCRYFRTSE